MKHYNPSKHYGTLYNTVEHYRSDSGVLCEGNSYQVGVMWAAVALLVYAIGMPVTCRHHAERP